MALLVMMGCASGDRTPVAPPADPPPASAPPAVVSFSLVDADTDEPITGFDPIREGATLDLSQVTARNLNIRINTDPPGAGSVVLSVVGDSHNRVQNSAPYTLFADSEAGLTAEPGAYHLSATPYGASGGQGTAGEPLNLSFRVSDGQSPAPPATPDEPPTPGEPGTPEVPGTPEAPVGTSLAVRIAGSPSGLSIKHIGANADVFNNDSFDIEDVRELGLTSYRYFGGMEEFEPTDDNGVYGSPSMAEMRQILSSDPSRAGEFVNWAAFDRNMAAYGDILRDLYTVPDMQPIAMLRNSANRGESWLPWLGAPITSCSAPDGSRVFWPEFSEADWNEWWQHVFAVAYWINVRNGADMRVDRWSLHNEPNQQNELHSEGWCGTKEQYLEFVKYTRDAIDFVYETYLDDRPRWLHGGVLSGGPSRREWLPVLFRDGGGSSFADRNYYQPSMFNVIDLHGFYDTIRRVVPWAREVARESGVPAYVRDYPIWVTEMGAHGRRAEGHWDQIPSIIDNLIDNLITVSTPGDSYAEGVLVWRMYDDDDLDNAVGGNIQHAVGLMKGDRSRRAGFYALKLAIMALNGGKEVFPTQLPAGTSDVMAITTREAPQGYNLLMSNRSESAAHDVQVDVSALLGSGSAELYRFDDARRGAESTERLALLEVSGGQLRFNLPPQSVVLVRFQP
ncbi:MAG: hypothetical protein M3498_03040 [Deinococcota bacterium]|nr:hypothetical protein [Deinococcota bacterium]